MLKRKKFYLYLFLVLLLAFLVILYCDKIVRDTSKGKLYTKIADVPYNRTGLLLGTAKVLGNGALNPYYSYRIEAASALMKSGKIKYLVISGDNSRKEYNEPQMMKMDLIHLGIDSNFIFLDYAGFRTFDSMVRLREIFDQDSVTVISQLFHNQRALYIAHREGISAIGFNARDVGEAFGLRVQVREKLARVKVFLDYLFGKEPKFLGPKIKIP